MLKTNEIIQQLEELHTFMVDHLPELLEKNMISLDLFEDFSASFSLFKKLYDATDTIENIKLLSGMYDYPTLFFEDVNKVIGTNPNILHNQVFQMLMDKLVSITQHVTEAQINMLTPPSATQDMEDLSPIFDFAEQVKGGKLTQEEKNMLISELNNDANWQDDEEDDEDQYYHYDAPEYAALAATTKLSTPLTLLAPINPHEIEFDDEIDTVLSKLESWDRETLATQVSCLIYQHLAEWQDDEGNEFLYGLRMALVIIEHFKLTECMDALMEILHQNLAFYNCFFIDSDLSYMVAATLAHIVTAEHLPMLRDFMLQSGISLGFKQQVAFGVADAVKYTPTLLPAVQQWLGEILEQYYPMGRDNKIFDEHLLESLFYCCIHTRAVDLKPLIIKFYSAYSIPTLFIIGGCNQVRKEIKNAELGILDEEIESAEQVLRYMYDDDFDEEDDFDDDTPDPYFNIEDYEWLDYYPRPHKRQLIYKPALNVKKYTLHISLNHIKPMIWREIEVPSNLTLTSLATVILLAMGWEDEHLHQFIVKKGKTPLYYSTKKEELENNFGLLNTLDGRDYDASDLFHKAGDTVTFEYDYGDSWYHTVKLTATSDYADEAKKVSLLDGRRACPPEDCGSVPGYKEICKAMEHLDEGWAQNRIEWLGARYNPEHFPLKEAQKVIAACNG
jgi:hypothetical protein